MAESWRGRRAVVTGAASGIGRAFARTLAGRGVDLVVCDLDEARLDALGDELRATGVGVEAHRVDVTDAAAVGELAARSFAGGPVHLLVNNAGVAVAGNVVDTSPEDWRWVVDVNLLGVVYGCHAFLPGLLAQGDRAAVVNISSASAFAGFPALGAYAATKAAVLSLSETLRAEVDPASVSVHCVCPGFVPTRLLDTARLRTAEPEASRKRVISHFFRDRGRSPEQVAEATLAAVDHDRFLVALYAEGHAARLSRSLPDRVRQVLLRQVARRMVRFSEES